MYLDHGEAVCLLDTGRKPCQPIDVIVRKTAKLPREALAYLLYMRGARHGQAKSTTRTHGQPTILIIRQAAVVITLRIRQRSERQAVLHGYPAFELQWLEQLSHERSALDPGITAQGSHGKADPGEGFA